MSKNYIVNCYTCQHNGQETCKGCNTLLVGEDEPYENWQLREDLETKDQRIAELEEQLKNAIVPPVKIGDKIYVVPSETNFKINNLHHKERNRIYEWEVHEIRFNKYGYAVVSWIDNIPFFCVDCETAETKNTYETQRFYKETWFRSKEEAQAKLEQLKFD